MGKNKYRRFQENLTFENLVQPSFEEAFHTDHPLKGRWREDFFRNGNPIVIELGCGRGEYTVALAAANPGKNFIGIDIKGARMWRGAKTATETGLKNAGFLRTRIEFINSFFGPDEVDEIWITFPDPQPKKQRIKKRLTSPLFLAQYAKFLRSGAPVHLKTDSVLMHDYTKAVALHNGLNIEACNNDIYGTGTLHGAAGDPAESVARFSIDGSPNNNSAENYRLGDIVDPAATHSTGGPASATGYSAAAWSAGNAEHNAAGEISSAAANSKFGDISNDITSIKTAYESRFLGEGRAITYLRFSLDKNNSFSEPDFEEEEYYPGEVRG